MNLSKLLRFSAFFVALLSLASFNTVGARADQVGDMLNSITGKLAPEIVTVNAVNTAHLTGQPDRDFRAELKGVIVSPDGLIMTTNAYFSGERFREALGGGPSDQPGPEIRISPKEIRITIGNESTEYYGSIAAQESSLGLAFIQIRDLKGRTLPFIDLAAASQSPVIPNVGDLTGSVTRLSKSYDFAPVAVEDRISGTLTKPRKAYIPEGYAGGLGLPVYTADGSIIGIVTDIERGDESGEDREAQALSRLFDDELADFHSQFIIPVAIVAPLVAEAKSRASELPPFVVPVAKPNTPAPPKPTTTAPITSPPTTPVKPATGSK